MSKEIDNLLREDILQEAEVRKLVEFFWLAGSYTTFEDLEDQGMFEYAEYVEMLYF